MKNALFKLLFPKTFKRHVYLESRLERFRTAYKHTAQLESDIEALRKSNHQHQYYQRTLLDLRENIFSTGLTPDGALSLVSLEDDKGSLKIMAFLFEQDWNENASPHYACLLRASFEKNRIRIVDIHSRITGQGAATLCIKALTSWAQKHQISMIYRDIERKDYDENGARFLNFYSKCGFSVDKHPETSSVWGTLTMEL